ncbi:MAG: cytochrome b/b6 domain-containing protein [Acidimicrobiales bacterium]
MSVRPRVDGVDGGAVVRFDRTERWLHWANATVFLVLLGTGMTLYVGPLSALVGRRVLVKDIHVIAGLLLPVPLLAAYAGPWRAGLRRDVRRLARWSRDDRRWLLSLGRRGHSRMGKFNAGQKLNAVFVAGCIPVMLGTGVILRWYEPFPIEQRTGATFVHDWLALALLVAITGHIGKALAEPVALRAMRRGTMAVEHVRLHHPRWWQELHPDAHVEEERPVPASGVPSKPSSGFRGSP